jgi:hypothetical protein
MCNTSQFDPTSKSGAIDMLSGGVGAASQIISNNSSPGSVMGQGAAQGTHIASVGTSAAPYVGAGIAGGELYGAYTGGTGALDTGVAGGAGTGAAGAGGTSMGLIPQAGYTAGAGAGAADAAGAGTAGGLFGSGNLGYLMAGSSALSGLGSYYSGQMQANAANNANANQMAMFNQTQANQKPYLQAGQNAVGEMTALTQPGSGMMHQFNASDLNANMAPNYAFQLAQGQGALTNQMSTMGGIGGNAMKGMQDYTQNTAAGAYQQAFSNYYSGQSNIFNRLASIAGLGQTSANVGSQVGAQTGNSMANTTTGGAAAAAGGLVGATNALTGGVNNYLGWNYLNSLTNQPNAMPSTTG